MFASFYNIFVKLSFLLLRILAPFNIKLKHFFSERSGSNKPKNGKIAYWIHCSSLGEYEMSLPLINRILEDISKEELLITFFSPSGYKVAVKNEQLKERIMYVPLDDPSAINAFFSDYSIDQAILVRYELWYNLIRIGLKKGVRFSMINARFRKDHFVFKWYAKPYFTLLKRFKYIFTSDNRSLDLLKKHAFENVISSADTRFDRVKEIADNVKKYSDIESFISGSKLVVAGSSWPAEEDMIKEVLSDVPDIKLIIAPHDVSEEHISFIEDLFGEDKTIRYSRLARNPESGILIIDSIGHLSSLYQYADVAIIGGGFKNALHNIFEPAVYGTAILFGNSHEKYPEANEFIQAGIAHEFSNKEELKLSLNRLLQSSEDQQLRAMNYINDQLGVSKKIYNQLKS